MLVKKELAEIPLSPFPKVTKKELRGRRFSASAAVHDLKKRGNILTVDIFDSAARTLRLRFFSDGVKYIICSDWNAQEWTKRVPKCLLNDYGGDVASTIKDDETVGKFLRDGQTSWYRGHTVYDHINGFASATNAKKRQRAAESKYLKMLEHFDMFPEYPSDLSAYCERHVFEHTYIFIDNRLNIKITKEKSK